MTHEETIKDKIEEWYWTQMRRIMNHTLRHYGYDFGTYYMDELQKMYTAHNGSRMKR